MQVFTRKLNRVLLLIILILVGVLAVRYFIDGRENKTAVTLVPSAVNQLDDVQKAMRKLRMEEAVLENVTASKELITMEIEMSEEASIDESWFSWDFLQKYQTIKFYGTGIYTTDLAAIQKGDVVYNEGDGVLSVSIQYPNIKAVVLDESKTEFTAVQKGLLRFGDVQITPSESEIIHRQVKEKMNESMRTPEMFNQACSYSKQAVEELITQLMAGGPAQDYRVEVSFKANEEHEGISIVKKTE